MNLPRSYTFTLDANCLIDVEENRPAAAHVNKLLQAYTDGLADLAIVASSASERQRDGGFLASMATFNERCSKLGFGDVRLLSPIMRWGVGFWDNGYWSWAEGEAREEEIYRVMFPTSPYKWEEYAVSRGNEASDTTAPAYLGWRNQILDAQAYWAHENANREIFVTSDRRFKKLEGLPNFKNATVKAPEEAVDVL